MSRLKILVAATAAALSSFGCSWVQPPQGPVVKPLNTVRNGGADAESLYRTGRYFQGRNLHEQALESYRKALALAPEHAKVHNALAVLHVQHGQPAQAEEGFRAALAIEPNAAYLHNNLGYFYLARGRLDEALAALQRASALDGSDRDIASNLATVSAKLGIRIPPAPSGTAVLAAIRPAPQQPPQLTGLPGPTVALERIADNIWQLHGASDTPPRDARLPQARLEVFPRSAVAAMAGASQPPVHDLRMSRIEIANGNGTTRLAAGVAGLLASQGVQGLQRPRLTNDTPYGVQLSVIQYVAGAEDAALEIRAALPSTFPISQVARLDRDMKVRILIGRDFQRDALPTASRS